MATTRQILLTEPDVVWSITVPRGMRIPVTAELVGGGGGGGAADGGGAGGSGSAGQYCKHVFTLSAGDILSFVVGNSGGGGKAGTGAAGGTAGSSMVSFPSIVFSLRTGTGNKRSENVNNPRWSLFMNTHAVWEKEPFSLSFDRTYEVTFPKTGTYQWLVQADNAAEYYLDGVKVAAANTFTGTEKIVDVIITAGVHTVSVKSTNSGDVGGVSLVIKISPLGGNFTGSLSGGPGGASGTTGTSGSGGGGGGASVLILNGTIIAAAGGGGGGGGAGNSSNGKSAGNSFDPLSQFYNGQEGQAKRGDGGGGGGSGGGLNAGAGGKEVSGDSGGNAGQPANSYNIDDVYGQNDKRVGSGVTPYITPAGFFATPSVISYGLGGAAAASGTSGYVKLVFETTYGSYKNGSTWQDVSTIYYKDSGAWQEAEGYIKIQGEWQPLARREIALYTFAPGILGTSYRNLAILPAPPPPPVITYSHSSGGESNWSGGWGGGFSSYSGGNFAGTQGSQGLGNNPSGGFDGLGDTASA
jgi:hypothetical protein